MEYLILKNIDPEKATNPNPNDKFIRFNSRTNLIEGLNNQKQPTGSLYNIFITEGDFFQIVNNTHIKDRSYMTAGNEDFLFGNKYILKTYIDTIEKEGDMPASGQRYDSYYINRLLTYKKEFYEGSQYLSYREADDIITNHVNLRRTDPSYTFDAEQWTKNFIGKIINDLINNTIYSLYITYDSINVTITVDQAKINRDVQSGFITPEIAQDIRDKGEYCQDLTSQKSDIQSRAQTLFDKGITTFDDISLQFYTFYDPNAQETSRYVDPRYDAPDEKRVAFRTLAEVQDLTVMSGENQVIANELEFRYNYY